MPPTNSTARLLALFEGSPLADEPVKEKFKGLKLNVDRLDADWGRRRLTGVRLAAFLLRQDSESLYACISTDLANYQDAIPTLKRDAVQLRKSAALVEKAVQRVAAVVSRCEREKRDRGTAAAHSEEVQP